MASTGNPAPTAEQEWRYASRAMAWYGWGSPVGVGVFLVSLGVLVALLRYAVWGG